MNIAAFSSSAAGGGHGALGHLLANGCSTNIAVSEFLAPTNAVPCNKRKRRPAGTPDPGAEVVALSPKTLMESDRYVCEICNQGFQRDQNLQMHRRRHKVPWKLLKNPSSLAGTNKRVYICPERSCLHHDPSHALGDLVGIKKHYRRKHCTDKQWKCVKCSKRYAVQSDYKAHLKTCGTRGHCCDCGRVFSRVESFIEHQDTCSAAAKRNTASQNNSSLLHHNVMNTDRSYYTSNVISPSHSSDTTQAISFAQYSAGLMSDTADYTYTKLQRPRRIISCQVNNQEVQMSTAATVMPSWLINTERVRNELELLPSIQRAAPQSIEFSIDQAPSHGSISTSVVNISCPDSKKDQIQKYEFRNSHSRGDMNTPCLQLSIGPTSSADIEMASGTCPSPHPSLDHRKPRSYSSVGKETLALSSHPAAIGKDLALSIPGTDNAGWLGDFLAQVDSKGLYQSVKKHLRNNCSSTTEIMANWNPCSEVSTSSISDHEGHLHESGVDRL